MWSAVAYRLLNRFEATFVDGPYRHRDSSLGNRIANFLYDDLYVLSTSALYNGRVDLHTRALNRAARSPGVKARRGDGSFGEVLPGATVVALPGFLVASAPTATIEIGTEVKIVAKAMLKQIGRVCSDLRDQASEFKKKNPDVVTVGIAGVNHAAFTVSYEGKRLFKTDGKANPHPFQEAEEVKRRLHADAEPAFDEFLVLEYEATNQAPFPFEWVSLKRTEAEYAAALVRILRRYESRFP